MPTSLRTSLSHPLYVSSLSLPNGGTIGLTFCPRKKQRGAFTGDWERDLVLDLDVVQAWGATSVVTLMEQKELVRFQVPGIGQAVADQGMTWYHLPIIDTDIPRESFERTYEKSGPSIKQDLLSGHRVLLHCLGGLGRTGTIAARLLIELGTRPGEAIDMVRRVRPGAIENDTQERYVRALVPGVSAFIQ
jgi:ADP-ribosyl-[dinitrogen reductase] hydrolase